MELEGEEDLIYFVDKHALRGPRSNDDVGGGGVSLRGIFFCVQSKSSKKTL